MAIHGKFFSGLGQEFLTFGSSGQWIRANCLSGESGDLTTSHKKRTQRIPVKSLPDNVRVKLEPLSNCHKKNCLAIQRLTRCGEA